LGNENDTDYKDILELMSSVTYDNISSYRIADNRMDLSAKIPAAKPSTETNQSIGETIVLILSEILTLAICCAPVLIMRFVMMNASLAFLRFSLAILRPLSRHCYATA
jgi:hypothetical protein